MGAAYGGTMKGMMIFLHINDFSHSGEIARVSRRAGNRRSAALKTSAMMGMALLAVPCLAANGTSAALVGSSVAVIGAAPSMGMLPDGSAALLTAAALPTRFAAAARASAATNLVLSSSSSDEGESFAVAATDLPESPGTLLQDRPLRASVPPGSSPSSPTHVAPRLTKYIPSGWTAQPLTGRDKFVLGVRDLYSPLNFLAVFISAGYEQGLNSQPNYGTDKGAFGERLGAAAIRESTQGFFSDSVFSPLLHEDPRYYIEGPRYNFFHRVIYAGTRPLISRTDSGRSTVNASLLLGYAASSALTDAYYPQSNRNLHDTVSTFGGAIGGAALGFVVSEFSDQVLQAFHLEKKQ